MFGLTHFEVVIILVIALLLPVLAALIVLRVVRSQAKK